VRNWNERQPQRDQHKQPERQAPEQVNRHRRQE
jgi:hypothetical protein